MRAGKPNLIWIHSRVILSADERAESARASTCARRYSGCNVIVYVAWSLCPRAYSQLKSPTVINS